MEKKKTISELYQECKQRKEMERHWYDLRDTTELFKKQLATVFYGALSKVSSTNTSLQM